MRTFILITLGFIGLHTESILISILMAVIIAVALSVKIEKK